MRLKAALPHGQEAPKILQKMTLDASRTFQIAPSDVFFRRDQHAGLGPPPAEDAAPCTPPLGLGQKSQAESCRVSLLDFIACRSVILAQLEGLPDGGLKSRGASLILSKVLGGFDFIG